MEDLFSTDAQKFEARDPDVLSFIHSSDNYTVAIRCLIVAVHRAHNEVPNERSGTRPPTLHRISTPTPYFALTR